MSKQNEALTLALEALKEYALNEGTTRAADKAIAAIEAVLPTDYRAVKTYHEGKPVYVSQPPQEPWRESASDYERGFIDGRQKQAQSSVDKAVNRMAQRTWVGLTDEEWSDLYEAHHDKYNQPKQGGLDGLDYERAIEAALRHNQGI